MTNSQQRNLLAYTFVVVAILSSVFLTLFVVNTLNKNNNSTSLTATSDSSYSIYSSSSYSLSSSSTSTSPQSLSSIASSNQSSSASSSSTAANYTYQDGTYTNNQTYFVHGSTDKVTVSITIRNDVITAYSVTLTSGDRESPQYVSYFNSQASSSIKNKKASNVSNVYVSGATLTSEAFNSALTAIKQQAS